MSHGQPARPLRTEYIQLLASLIEACSRFPSTLNRSQVVDRLMRATLEISGLEAAVVALRQPDAGAFDIIGSDGSSHTLSVSAASPILEMATPKDAIGKAVFIEDITTFELPGPVMGTMRLLDTRSCLIAPMVSGDEVLGALLLPAAAGIAHVTPGIVQSIEVLAHQATVSLKNAELYEAECSKSAELEAVLSSIQDGVLILREGRVVFANAAAERIIGSSIEVGMSPQVVIEKIYLRDATGRRLTLDELPSTRALRGEVFAGYEVIVGTVTGEDRIMHVSGSPVRGKGESIMGAVIVIHDVTDFRSTQAQLEEALAKSRRQGEELIETAHSLQALLTAVSSIGRTLDLSDTLEEIVRVIQRLTKFPRVAAGLISDEGTHIEYLTVGGGTQTPHGARIELRAVPPELRFTKETKEPFVVERGDPSLSDEARRFLAAHNMGSLLISPIICRRGTIGHISVDIPGEAYRFTDYDIKLLKAIAAHAAVAIDNAKLFHSAEKMLARVTMLNEITMAVTGLLDLREVAQRVLELLRVHLEISAAGVHVLNKSGSGLEYIARFNVPDEVFNELRYIPLGMDTLSTRAFTTQRIVTSEDSNLTMFVHEMVETMRREGDNYMAIPLIYRGRSVGSIVGFYPPERRLDEHETEALMAAGRQIAAAVENARLFEAEQAARREEEERAKGLDMLYRLTSIATSSLEVQELSRKIIEYLVGKFEITIASIWLFDPDKRELVLEAGMGCPQGFFERLPSIPLDEKFEAARVFMCGEPAVVEDIKTAALPVGTRELIETTGIGAGAYLFLPLKARKTMVGVLSVSWSKARRFTKNDIEFYKSVANQIAVGVENARLHEATERELAMVRVTNAVASAVARTLDVKELCAHAASALMEYLELGGISIFVTDEASVSYRNVLAFGDLQEAVACMSQDVPFDAPSMVAVAAREKRILSPDVHDSLPERTQQAVEPSSERIKRCLFVPCIARAKVWAVIVGCFSREVTLTGPIEQVLEAIATQIAVGIENARRFEAEKNIADTLQSALLVMPERIDGIRFGSLYRSATEAAKVGGDFYEIFELDTHTVGIIIGDVSGKGIEAAAFTSLVKNTIRAYAFDGALPSAVVTKTNDIILGASPESIFITVFFGILNKRSGELVYCSGGHLPAVVKRAGGEVELLTTSSPIIGAFPDMEYHDDAVVLEKGDILVLYTDGVTEARFDGKCFDEENLFCLLRELPCIPVEEIPYAIFADLDAYTQGCLSDDVVLLAIGMDK